MVDARVYSIPQVTFDDFFSYSVQILSCGGCEEALSFTVDSEMGSLSGIPLQAGRYYVDVSRDPEAAPDVSVLLRAP